MRLAAGREAVVLAVSGGRDSMALLHAAARALTGERILVATFDHATGPAATRAAELVAAEAARLGLPAVIGRAARDEGSEAGWRARRHRFLDDACRAVQGRLMTAHTRDDHVETVLMRVLRDAGARGLAGLYAATDIRRPLLAFSRDEVAAYAREQGARWIEDPTNSSPAYLRNRVRRDLLPALRLVAPGLGDALLEASERAAALRATVDAWLDAHVSPVARGGHASVAARPLGDCERDALMLLWPAIAARAGLVMDWRGTERAAAFTRKGRVGATIPLSGGWVLARARDRFELSRAASPVGSGADAALGAGLRWHDWRFTTAGGEAADAWTALLPEGCRVRAWRAGDRMTAGRLARRVKRYLSDAKISGQIRALWHVVLKDDEIVWIPGVRRSDAAAVRPGRPGTLYRCDFDRSS